MTIGEVIHPLILSVLSFLFFAYGSYCIHTGENIEGLLWAILAQLASIELVLRARP